MRCQRQGEHLAEAETDSVDGSGSAFRCWFVVAVDDVIMFKECGSEMVR